MVCGLCSKASKRKRLRSKWASEGEQESGGWGRALGSKSQHLQMQGLEGEDPQWSPVWTVELGFQSWSLHTSTALQSRRKSPGNLYF